MPGDLSLCGENPFWQEMFWPVEAINQYLSEIYSESLNRNYNFDKRKIDWSFKKGKLTVTTGQLNYEVSHLLLKLKTRDINKYNELKAVSAFDVHPLFTLVDGDIEKWEILPDAENNTTRKNRQQSK
jgi:hypothetical protein